MKKPVWQDVFFVFSVLVFACLLLSGGSRLIAAPDESVISVITPSARMEASLNCPPSAAHEWLQTRQQEMRRITADGQRIADNGFVLALIPLTDANGNVLRHQSYMHAVYQVFVLDDGFA